jgi:type IV secretion system protein TrbL
VVMALVTFKFGSLVGFVLMPIAVLTKTAFIAERPLGWVVGSGVRLMVLTLVLGIGNNIFQTLKMPPGSTVTTYQAFCIALAAALLMVLSLVASRLASDLIVGGPSLGVGTAINTTASTYNTAVGGVTSRPAVIAVKAAAAVSTKGASLAYSAGGAAVRGVGRAVSGGAAKAATPSATTGGSTNGAPKASGGATSSIASRIPGKGPGGKGGSSTT